MEVIRELNGRGKGSWNVEDKDLQDLVDALESGYKDRVAKLTRTLLEKGMTPHTILNDGLIAGMALVGEKMRKNEMYLPDVLQSAAAMDASMNILKPYLVKDGIASRGKIVLGTVKGDMHDIGKHLVGIMLQGAGFEVIDLGTNVLPTKFVEAINAHQPAILGLSAMLTTTMLNMKTTIDAITEAGLRLKLKIIVGGAPVRDQFAKEIGADGYARDALTAVDKVKELLANDHGNI